MSVLRARLHDALCTCSQPSPREHHAAYCPALATDLALAVFNQELEQQLHAHLEANRWHRRCWQGARGLTASAICRLRKQQPADLRELTIAHRRVSNQSRGER